MAQQLEELGGLEAGRGVRALKEPLGEVALVVVQGDDLLLDGPLRDQAVDRHRAGLADAMGAVRGLVLGGRIPLRVHVDHEVGRGQVEFRPPPPA